MNELQSGTTLLNVLHGKNASSSCCYLLQALVISQSYVLSLCFCWPWVKLAMSDPGLSKPYFINHGHKAPLQCRFWIYGNVIIIFGLYYWCLRSVWVFYEREDFRGLTKLSKIYQHVMQVWRVKHPRSNTNSMLALWIVISFFKKIDSISEFHNLVVF